MAKSADAVNVTDVLGALLQKAEAADARMGRSNPNRQLLQQFAAFAVGMTQEVAQLRRQLADKPLIVLP